MSNSKDNLEEAFSGESQARNKYTFFAEKAEEEGKTGIAKLFRAAALAEKVHARNHLQALDKIKSTKENLKVAIEGENYEHEEMYPEFIEKAKDEGNKEALKSFNYANSVEKKHEKFYRDALENLEKDGDTEKKEWYVCEVCGNTVSGEPPEKCPICGASKEEFIKA